MSNNPGMNATPGVYGGDVYYTLLSNYISYERLFPMCQKALYGDDNVGEVNFFIDLNSYLKRLWDPRPMKYKSDNVFAASIINCCAHYRNYLWTRHMVKSNFYLIWGYNTPTYLPVEYNAHFRERVATMVEGQERLEYTKRSLEFLCPFLPQIYFVDGGEYEVSATIGALLTNAMVVKKGLRNIILSKDPYAYQLVAYYPNTFLFRPKKRSVEGMGLTDQSWVVTKTNLYNAFKIDCGYVLKKDSNPSEARHLEYVLAMAGMTKRHVKGIMTFNRACQVVRDIEFEAPEQLDNISKLEYSLIFDPIVQCRGIGFREPGDLSNRKALLDLNTAVDILIHSPKMIDLEKGIVDLYNKLAIQEISDKEFGDYPLELMEL